MAGLICSVNTPADVALVAATAKTVLQITAPTNQRLRLKSFGVFFDGTSSTAVPVLVRVLRQTTAGTATSATPVRLGAGSETVQTTASYNASVEPTASDVLHIRRVHPQSGYERMFTFDAQDEIPGGTRLGLEATAAAIVNVRAEFTWDE